MDKALEKHIVTAEVNPLQVSILMDVLNDCLPGIQEIFESQNTAKFTVGFDDIGKTVGEIYRRCYSETGLFEDAKRIFEETGSFPDIHTLLEINAQTSDNKPGPGENKSIEFEIIPGHEMLVYLMLRGYFNQFQEMMTTHFSNLVHLDLYAMQESADAIHEASIGKTDIKEKAAPIIEVLKMTGQFPDGVEN
jgi:hypothetical protein